MSLIRTTAWNGMAIAVRLSTGLVLNKLLAMLIGPAGYAIIGQFQNATNFLFGLSGSAINNGVVKLSAEAQGDPARLRAVVSTAFRIVVTASLAVGVCVALFSGPLSRSLMHADTYRGVFVILGTSIILYSLNALLLALLNGRRELRPTVYANIIGSAITLVTMAALTYWLGVYGALVSLAINQSLLFFATLALCVRRDWFRKALFSSPFSPAVARKLLWFALMTLTSAAAINGGQVLVRNIVIANIDVTHAGYWDAMVRLSTLNWQMVSAGMGFYFLPKMTELIDWPDAAAEIRRGMKVIIPFFIICSLILYLARDLVVIVLFSNAFRPVEALFAWQLTGDVFRVATWFFAYVMIGREMFIMYALFELITNLLFVLLSWFWLRQVGFEGVAIAHCVTYALILPGMFLAARHGTRQVVQSRRLG